MQTSSDLSRSLQCSVYIRNMFYNINHKNVQVIYRTIHCEA